MSDEPRGRPDGRVFCYMLSGIFLVLFLGLISGLATWHKVQTRADRHLETEAQKWHEKLNICNRERETASDQLLTRATRIGCLYKDGSPYHAAVKMAIADANALLSADRISVSEQMSPLQRATGTTNSTDETWEIGAVRRLYSAGVRMFIGLSSSEALVGVLRWAKTFARDALFLSPSATAGDLRAQTGPPALILLSAEDAALATVLLYLVRMRRVTHLLPVVVQGMYGSSMLEEVRRAATSYGKTDSRATDGNASVRILPAVRYSLDDVSSEHGRDTVKRAVVGRLTAPGPSAGRPAILLVAGSEASSLLREWGREDSLLGSMPWYATDSVALRRDILESPIARQAAVRVNLTALIHTDAEPISQRFGEKMALQTDTDQVALDDMGGAEVAPNLQRAYRGTLLLAELGRMMLLARQSDVSSAARLLAAASRSEAHGGQFDAVQVVRMRSDRLELISAADTAVGEAGWLAVHRFSIASDTEQTSFLSRVSMNGGVAYHRLRRGDLATLYEAIGGCGGDSLRLLCRDPSSGAALRYSTSLQRMPDTLLVPADHAMRAELNCADADAGLLQLTLRCPGVLLPRANTLFCLVEAYRVTERPTLLVPRTAVRWQQQRRVFSCRPADYACALEPGCQPLRSCFKTLVEVVRDWMAGEH